MSVKAKVALAFKN